ncbi:MAG: hypothetical protein HQ517_02225 [SAR324 cluster bacterium]|nr:hypothetical protein [SAR324 cluster bacterium]
MRETYTSLISTQINEAALALVFNNLVQLRNWIGYPASILKIPTNRKYWLEFIADAFHEHQRATGLGLAEHDLLPHVLKGDRSSDQLWVPRLFYRVALDNLRSAFNVGSIMRLIDATGFESVMMTLKTPGLENKQVEKTAMGVASWIPQKKTDQMAADLRQLKVDGYHIIGVETVTGSASYQKYPWPKQGVVVMGNEEYGISQSILPVCDDFVHIPMSGHKNSINVANAFAVIAFHISALKSNS